jgi:hypothetical protein
MGALIEGFGTGSFNGCKTICQDSGQDLHHLAVAII